MSKEIDIIVIGAGLVGLSTAYHLLERCPEKRVLIIEKELGVAHHQSGHNSGVIHSGIYYKPGSLKARNCMEGYRQLLDFAQKHRISHDICGKIIVATDKTEEPALVTIYDRGLKNGLTGLKLLSTDEIADYEPYVKGTKAIYVPQTGIIDYPQMAEKLLELCRGRGAEIVFGQKVIKIDEKQNQLIVHTDKEVFTTIQLVSCAGLQSDNVARLTSSNYELQILPFRGEYYKLKPEKEYLVKNLVYPVPDIKFPFLGVHFTRMISGGIEAGPNAVLSFKREGYHFSDFDMTDVWETFTWPGFWKVVARYGRTGMGEMYRSLSKRAFTKALQKLIPSIHEDDLAPGGSGVRAQACDRQGNLLDDFNIKRSNRIIHVGNAPSPAATSCLSIGKYITGALVNT
ncbi:MULTISPECIES: L-2-hydroxyglutarate oxidase [Olivibacter]|uniref:L-2-hydroxyglutarate oxidase n=1 Tax=Olivibacter jilunii TaxID=985016 RepID=A0ABW6BBC1_9SPHI|nr:L-2-hydroxyglutarate oxidase [Olivibacter sp. UJ_SKK_5.1]MDX3912646.1 L-2-hydroxyglutarate oxidase [Pseudosphingobacterium sp.]